MGGWLRNSRRFERGAGLYGWVGGWDVLEVCMKGVRFGAWVEESLTQYRHYVFVGVEIAVSPSSSSSISSSSSSSSSLQRENKQHLVFTPLPLLPKQRGGGGGRRGGWVGG